MQTDERNAAALGAALLFTFGLWSLASANVTVAIVLALAGIGVLAIPWKPKRAARRAAVFLGSILVMGWVLHRDLLINPGQPASPTRQPTQPEGSPPGFLDFLGQALGLEFGQSVYFGQPIRAVLVDRIAYDVALLTYALALAAVLVGVLWLASRRQEEVGGRVVEAVAHLGSGLPPLVWTLGFVLLAVKTDVGDVVFGADLQEVGMLSADAATSFLLPALALALPLAGHAIRELRAAGTLGSDRPAGPHQSDRSAGLSRSGRAGLATLSAHWIHGGYLVGAMVVVEAVYAIPGVGQLWLTAFFNLDIALAVAAAFVLTLIGLFGLLLRDALATASPWGVSPWADAPRSPAGRPPAGDGGTAGRPPASDGGTAGPPPAGDGGTAGRPSLAEAVRESLKAKLGAGLLGITVLLALYGNFAADPTRGGMPGLRTPGFGDLAVALWSLLHVGVLAVAVAAVVGVPLGVVLRGDDAVRRGVRDFLRAFAALPLLVLVFHLLPAFVDYGILGKTEGAGSYAVAIGVAVAPYLALSAADLFEETTAPAGTDRAQGRRRQAAPDGGRQPDDGGRPPDDDGRPPDDGGRPLGNDGGGRSSTGSDRTRGERSRQGTGGTRRGTRGSQSRSGPGGSRSGGSRSRDGAGGHHSARRQRDRGDGRPGGRGTAPRRREATDLPALAPVAIPLCVYFGYAIFLTAAFAALGVESFGPRGQGLPYLASHLQTYMFESGTKTFLLLAATVGLPALGANLLADGLGDALRSGPAAGRRATGRARAPAGRSGQPDDRSGDFGPSR